MKGNTRFVIGIAAFLVLVFVLQLNMPRQFRWIESFRHNDDQPFGCKLFDRVLTASLPEGYEVSQKSFPMLLADSGATECKRSFLVLSDFLPGMDSLSINAMLQLAHDGNKIFLSVYDLPDLLCDTLFLDTHYYNWFSLRNFRKKQELDSLYRWPDVGDTAKIYTIPDILITCSLRHKPTSHVTDSTKEIKDGDTLTTYITEEDPMPFPRDTLLVLKEDDIDPMPLPRDTLLVLKEDYLSGNDSYPVLLVHYTVGKGDIYVCCFPLLLTNYGMLEGYDDFIFDLLTPIADRPVVRVESYMKSNDFWTGGQPTRVILQNPPLKWAWRLTVLGILLFMFFTARRRLRVAPVYEEPENRQLEFVQLIGTLYYQRHDNADLVSKKYSYFAEEVRRLTGVDITDDTDDDHTIDTLAEKTGLDMSDVKKVILRSRMAARYAQPMDDRMMRFYIDQMNRIIKEIKKT